MEERGQFTFYKSYWDAIETLPAKDRLPILEAIIKYALFGEDPQTLTAVRRAVFLLTKPTLDSSRKKAANGKQGGSKTEARRKQTESKREANGKQTASEKEKENEIEKENEKEIEIEGEKEKDKKQTGSTPPLDGRSFTEFWKAYPVGKGGDREEAWRAWKELSPSTQTVAKIMDGLNLWVESDQWAEDAGRYIPGAARFLRESRWLSPPVVQESGSFTETLTYAKELMARRSAGV